MTSGRHDHRVSGRGALCLRGLHRRALFLSLLITGLLIGGCADDNRVPELQNVPVVVFVMDTLRADRLGTYGYPRPTSPNIDALAGQSVLFEQAYSTAPWTLPSMTSLITSTFPCEHDMVSSIRTMNHSVMTFAESLQQSGYYTGGYYANVYVGPNRGLSRGYDNLIDRTYVPRQQLYKDLPNQVRNFLAEVPDRRFLLYLHMMEPHDPYLVPQIYSHEFGYVDSDLKRRIGETIVKNNVVALIDWQAAQTSMPAEILARQVGLLDELEAYRKPMNQLYDASVAWADEVVGSIIEVLKEEGVWDEALFIFLSDHGEEIGEHGSWGHRNSVYEELTRVPLLIHFPGNEMAGRRIDTPVSLVDVMPTVLDYLGLADLCRQCRGQSLLKLAGGLQSNVKNITFHSVRQNVEDFFKPLKESRGDTNVSMRQGNWKGIWNSDQEQLELYDLDLDSGETENVAHRYPELAGNFEKQARTWLRECQGRRMETGDGVPPDPQVFEQLRSLGYVH
jgi:arylsulfatase A-like enzyme